MLKFNIFLLLFILSQSGVAQHQTGMQYSNYVFPLAHETNPASLGSSKLKVGINFVNAEASIFNNYVNWNAPFSFVAFFSGQVSNQYKNSSGLIIWKEEYTRIKNNKNLINGAFNATLTGPSLFYRFEKIKLGIQTGLNIKTLNSFNNTSEEIGNLIVKGAASPNFNNLVLNNQSNLNLGYFKEWYLSLGRTIHDFGETKLKVGLTAKYLTGDSFMSINAQNLDYTVSQDPTVLTKSNTRFDRTIGNLYISENSSGFNTSTFINELLYVKGNYGFSGSIGFIFEYNPEYRKSSKKHNNEWIEIADKIGYKYKIGLSFNDFGKLNYSNARISSVNSSSPILFESGDIMNNATPNNFYNLINDKFVNDVNTRQTSLNFFTPSRIQGFIDYQLKEHQFLTVFANQSIDLNTAIGFKGLSSYGIIPRYETKNFEFSMPIIGQNIFQNITLGLSGRYRGFYLGTNHFLGFFNFSKTKGASIFGGVFIPLYYKPKGLGNECYYPSDKNKKSKNPFSKIKKRF